MPSSAARKIMTPSGVPLQTTVKAMSTRPSPGVLSQTCDASIRCSDDSAELSSPAPVGVKMNDQRRPLTVPGTAHGMMTAPSASCLLYTSDAADDLLCVDLGGRRIIKK